MEEKKEENRGGRPEKSIKKDQYIQIRVTRDERLELEKLFKASNLSTKTEFIKACIFGKEIKAPEMPLITYYKLIGNLLKEINKSGQNINQITKKVNSLSSSETSLKLISYEMNKVLEEQIYIRQLTQKIVEYLDLFRNKFMKR